MNLFVFLKVFSIIFLPTVSTKELYDYVTQTSLVKLTNLGYQVRLHSHDVKYSTGSYRHSVTGVTNSDDKNSYWVIFNGRNNQTKRGEYIPCNSAIRLKHMVNKEFLRSDELYNAPLTSNQEVSTDVDLNDNSDNWIVLCKGDYWKRSTPVMLRHQSTNCYLGISGHTYQRPIEGQYEACCVSEHMHDSKHCNWRTVEGLYVKPTPEDEINNDSIHNEL